MIDVSDLHALESRVREVALDELMPRFTRVAREEKRDGSFVTEADLVVQKTLSGYLASSWPQIPFLGEEMDAEEQAGMLATDGPLWCLDPLDGTTNFVSDIPYFCISLSLLLKGKVQVALVFDPNRNECFSALRGKGAMQNGEPIVLRPWRTSLEKAAALVDFKRLSVDLSTRLVTRTPYASQRSFGSVALDLCWIAAGRCDVYLHGRSNIWDYGAGLLILEESGGRACTLDGEPVFSSRLEPRSIVAAAESTVFDEWCDWLGVKPEVR